MNCQDNSRLKVPLPEMCKTTDIGCVPISSGKPDCPPEPDQLPLSYDPDTQTLWIFSCETRQWIPQTKFTLGELQEVSLDNIRNICELLNVPVYYNPGGGTVQGSLPLGEFAEKLLSCITLENKVAILPSGNVAFSIEGLESLDPLYVRFENLTASGAGTNSSPLVIKAEDPITKWPRKTEADVENAENPMLAANLDGEKVQVPYPKKPCEYPRMTQSQVEGAQEALIIGCVDENNVKIPYPPQPKDYDSITQGEVDGSTNRWLVAVVNGEQVRIPFPQGVCEYTRKTKEEIASSTTDIVACVGGEASKIPLSTLKESLDDGDRWICDLPSATSEELDSVEGFSIAICIGGVMKQMFIECGSGGKEFPAIPMVCGEPSGPPAEGTPPLRLDCGNFLWVWDENAAQWVRVGGSSAPDSSVPAYSTIAGNVANKCTDTVVRGYYMDRNAPDAGYKETKINGNDLVNILSKCGLVADDEVEEHITPDSSVPNYSTIASNINNKCTDTVIRGYYIDKNASSAGYKNMKMSVKDLVGVLDKCGLATDVELAELLRSMFETQRFSIQYWTGGVNVGRALSFSNVTLDENYYGEFALHSQRWNHGSGTIVQSYDREGNPHTPATPGGKIVVTNPYDKPATAVCYTGVTMAISPTSRRYTQTVHVLLTDDPTASDAVVRQKKSASGSYVVGAPTGESAIASVKHIELSPVGYYYSGPVDNPSSQSFVCSVGGRASVPFVYTLQPNESKNLYMRVWYSVYVPRTIYIPDYTLDRPNTIESLTFSPTTTVDVSIFPNE